MYIELSVDERIQVVQQRIRQVMQSQFIVDMTMQENEALKAVAVNEADRSTIQAALDSGQAEFSYNSARIKALMKLLNSLDQTDRDLADK